ncbi:hypothetical protein V500_00350 [Pseudogymnoascus sp. VKM F-4518 (FW-2643)]|nr:hypothetical protein V500_00350 [Pseudogymnoascus sp. VKM F-4518 (FW-2643)]
MAGPFSWPLGTRHRQLSSPYVLMIYHYGDSYLIFPLVKKSCMRRITAVDDLVGSGLERQYFAFLLGLGLGLGVARMQGEHSLAFKMGERRGEQKSKQAEAQAEVEQRLREEERQRREAAEAESQPKNLIKYLEACHTFSLALKVITDKSLSAQGDATIPTGRLFPQRIVP